MRKKWRTPEIQGDRNTVFRFLFTCLCFPWAAPSLVRVCVFMSRVMNTEKESPCLGEGIISQGWVTSSGKGASLPSEQLLARSLHQTMKILTFHQLLYSLRSIHAHFQSLPTGWHAGLPHLATPVRQLLLRTKPHGEPTPPRRVTRWHLTTCWKEVLVQWFQWLGLRKAPLFCPAPKGPNQSEF